MSARPDVVVVGAGIIGLSIALQLSERGASVTVLDRAGVGAGASGVQPGGVRLQWGTRINCLLARESMRFYADAERLLQMRVDPGFQACGYLFLAHSDAALARLRENVELQNELGIESRIVAPAEARELVPGLEAADLVGASWCAEDGYFDRPQSVVEALGALVDVRIEEVADLDGMGADAVVVAAGVDTPKLLPELPITAERRALFLSDPIGERLLEPLVVSTEREFAAKQLANGCVLASDLREGSRANVQRRLEELLPRLVFVAFPTLVEGLYDVTPDRQPILGRVRDRVWVAAGFSGHGFMMAPAVGRVVAEAMVGDTEDDVLAVLDARRFAEGRLVPEPQVI